MNLPNKLSIARICLIPVFMIFSIPLFKGIEFLEGFNNFVGNEGQYIAVALFIIAACTDFVDGYIARKYDLITNLGKFLDPIADKLLVTAALIVLVEQGVLSSWVALIILAREFIVTGLRVVAASEGIVLAASYWGKIKTVTQMVAIVILLLGNFPFSLFTQIPVGEIVMGIAVILTLYSGYDYIIKNKQVFNA